MAEINIAQGFNTITQAAIPEIIAGDFPCVLRLVTVTGEGLRPRNPHGDMVTRVIPMGMVLGQGDTDGRYRKAYFIANDGSQNPSAILAETIDVSDGDVRAWVYLSGVFNMSAVSWADGHTLFSVTASLRQRSIFICN